MIAVRWEIIMSNYYTENEFNELVDSLAGAVKNFNLVVFIGAGISLSQGYPNWNGYIEKLIHFWQFNIQHVAGEKVKVSSKLLSQFDEILKSNNGPKRKIDLLHTLLHGILGEEFDDVKLNFEKYFFKEVVPDYLENSVLVELIKLDPIFITSNYDFEIEKHLKRIRQKDAFKSINNIHEFTTWSSRLTSGDVLHLHGTTEGEGHYFVNSSLDYSRQYLKETQEFQNLRTWFETKQPIVLFLGSSMEEEEILSLLPATSKNFAMMKAEPNESQEFRNLYNQTYQKNNRTTIFWYGDDYDDLPKEVEKMVSTVQKKIEVSKSSEDWAILHSISTDNEIYQKTLEKYSEDERYLSDIFKTDDIDLQKKILKITLRSQIILKKISNISSFWNMVSKNFNDVNNEQLKIIIGIFNDEKLNIYCQDLFEVYKQLPTSDNISKEDMNEVRRHLAQNQSLVNTSFSEDSDLMGYWLSEQFQQENSHHRNIFYGEQSLKINLRSELIMPIIESLKEEGRYLYWSFNEIVSMDGLIKIIYNSLLDEKLLYEDTFILDNFPEPLLETRLFQRMLVNIDNEKELPNPIVNKLIAKIDFTDTIFGTELNEFARKHKTKIGEDVLEVYENAIESEPASMVYPRSFIDSSQILKENEESILEILLGSQDESFSQREDFYSEKTNKETSNYLLNLLKKNDVVSQKIEKIIIDKGSCLYPKFDRLFLKILTDDYNPDLKEKALSIFLEKFNLDSFSWEEKFFFQELISKKEFENIAFEKLFQVDVNKLSYNYVYVDKERPELIERDDFMNTELGRYLDILILLNKKDKSKRGLIKEIVANVNFNQFREFTQGALTTVDNSVDLEKVTINTFQGYSFSISGFKQGDLDKFKLIGQELLKKGYVNNVNQNNLFLIALSKINPSDEEMEINWNSINFSWILILILQSEFEFEYENEWLREIMLHDKKGNFARDILYYLDEDSTVLTKGEKALQVFEENISDYKGKVNIHSLSDSLKEQKNSEKKDLLIKLFFLLLENAKIEKSYFGSRTLLSIMQQLPLESKKRLAGHANLSTVLSPLEIDELKRAVD
ncbi:SIR2 family protein [Enterococcus sp. DIV0784]|uniref:SIR2 family protein n=2 Tax=unclassified Enterococcus TaxID=2608891 RepID=UPI003F6822C6